VKIFVKTRPTYIIPIDPTKALTEEVIPTFELAQKVPPPPGGIMAKAGTTTYSDIPDLIRKIPKLLKSEGMRLEEIQHLLNIDGEDNQDPEILEALEELVSAGYITQNGTRWMISERNRRTQLERDREEWERLLEVAPDYVTVPRFEEWLKEKESGLHRSSIKIKLRVTK
jgi:DNA-binding transcriptional MerR regulator